MVIRVEGRSKKMLTLAAQITLAAQLAGENESMMASSPAYNSTIQPPWVMPPVEFNQIDEYDYVAIPALGDNATVVQFKVPAGYNGIIHSYGNNFVGGSFVEGTGDIVWQLMRDRLAIKGYGNILGSLGNPSAPTRHPSGFRIFENQTIALIVKNIAQVVVAGQKSGGRLLGWYYPVRYEDPGVGIQ